MRVNAWGLGWRVVVALLVPFGWLALLFLGGTRPLWSNHVKREYLLWRWRRSYSRTVHRLLDARHATLPPDAPGKTAAPTLRKGHSLGVGHRDGAEGPGELRKHAARL
jgi:hypothetical protein